MGLFKKKEKSEDFTDSVYQRRLARGEVPATPQLNCGYANIKELRKQIKELTAENSRLHSQIEKMQEYMIVCGILLYYLLIKKNQFS